MKRVVLSSTVVAAIAVSAVFMSCNKGKNDDRKDTSIELDMVLVQGGTFMMGSPAGSGLDRERPQHQVTVNSFSIGKFQVTQKQWMAVMGDANTFDFQKDSNYPAEPVSWNDVVGTSGTYIDLNGVRYYANGFVYKLNQLTGKNYRLPTEAEWEYAARGGNKSKNYTYSGSNTIGDVTWYKTNSGGASHSVGTKAANELGIYDMSGNVWEWCSDWYGLYTSETQTDPAGPASGSARVLRGGSWQLIAADCRVVNRASNNPDVRNIDHGLRLVLP